MAKKKTKDTKGLAGIVKNVPRELDIKGQKHMLAWITPKEGEALQALGGSGEAGPMGIPAYIPDDGNKGGSFSGPEDRGELGGGTDKGSSVSGGSKGGGDDKFSYDADTGIDAETDDPDTAGAGSKESPGYDPATKLGTRIGKYGQDPANVENIAKHISDMIKYGKTGYDSISKMGLGGYTQEQYADLNRSELGKRIKSLIDEKRVHNYALDEQGRIVGVSHETQGLPGVMGAISGLISQLTGKPMIGYTGRTGYGLVGEEADPFGLKDGDGPDRNKISSLTSLQEKPEEVVPVSVSPADYYGKGVGSATINLYDPKKIDAYLAQLYGQTPSPIGAEFNPVTGTYTMKGGDKKRRTRLRGLDIFKPVSM